MGRGGLRGLDWGMDIDRGDGIDEGGCSVLTILFFLLWRVDSIGEHIQHRSEYGTFSNDAMLWTI